ncbi:MAG: divalent-cation tolerance protein CutA [Spirochaetales bacterium]|nr:divalent-cation tolerance protein CutA [Spirochaetales bacterium]
MNPRAVPIVATTTTPTRRDAELLARTLVERRLAACVQIVDPIRSVYRWDGAIHDEPEVLLIIKSLEALLPAVEAVLKELHPYEVPELIAVPAASGSSAYLRWIEQCVAEPDPSGESQS